MVFLILATALSSTVFMQMFGGDFTGIADVTDPENRFDTFWESFVSLIVVYTSETWTVSDILRIDLALFSLIYQCIASLV
jgi:hypothetical protein